MSKAAKQSITPICPVERLGREWAELADIIDALGEKGRGLTPHAHIPISQRLRVLVARQSAIQEQVSWMTPRSPAGALFQMALAFTGITIVYSEGGVTMEQVARLMFGTRAYLVRQSGMTDSGVGGDRLMPESMDARNLTRDVA